VLLVHLGSLEDGRKFFESRWPEARAVSDESEELYEAFGLGSGSVGQLFGPGPIWEGLKATLRGNIVGMPVGNPMRMSGWFLVDRGKVAWSHVHEHAGSARRYDELAAACKTLAEATG
jgi:hypothetical protein